MAKKVKLPSSEPQPSVVPSRDVLQRLNYLYQVSTALAAAIPPTTSSTSTNRKGKEKALDQDEDMLSTQPLQKKEGSNKKQRRRHHPNPADPQQSLFQHLSQSLISNMKDTSKKGTVRMDPTLKRTFCKNKSCQSLLIPGITCSVRNRPSKPHSHLIVLTCGSCGEKKKLPQPPLMELLPSPPPPSSDPNTTTTSLPRPPPPSTSREKKDRKRARKTVFFERGDHSVFMGNDNVLKKRRVHGDADAGDSNGEESGKVASELALKVDEGTAAEKEKEVGAVEEG